MPDASPWLLVGLGNPGPKYAEHRHNVGFMVVQAWVDAHGAPGASWREKWKGQTMPVTGSFGRCVALLPQTYMNCSGESVGPAMRFHQIPSRRLVVVHDEIDFDFGRIAIKSGGGHGGHNGLRDIIAHIGTRDFIRIRFGIGRPQRGDVSSWVLSNFSSVDAATLPDHIVRARHAITSVFTHGVKAAMNEFNVSQV